MIQSRVSNRRCCVLRRHLLLAALLPLSACAGGPDLVGSKDVVVTDNSALPPPERGDLAAEQRPYLIGPFDKLTIDVFGVKDLSGEVQADASGRISMPLAGTIEAAGRTPAELANEIEQRLRERYIRDPQVTVNLKDTVSQVVTVDGEVKEPGLYPVIGHMTLMRAVATAKGLSEFSKPESVVIFRTVGGRRLAALYDLKSIRKGLHPDPEVFANDVVVVGYSQAKRLFKDLVQITPLLTTPIIYLVR